MKQPMRGRKGQIGFYIKFLAIIVVLIFIFGLTGGVWSDLLTSATEAANMSGGEAWFYQHYPAVILGIGTLILFVAGSVVLGGGED